MNIDCLRQTLKSALTGFAIVLLCTVAGYSQEQCSLRCKLTTQSPGWFTSHRSVMRPTVGTAFGKKASIQISSGPSLSQMSIRASLLEGAAPTDFQKSMLQDPRNQRYYVSLMPTLESAGKVRLAIVLECVEPGRMAREIKTTTILEEGKPWECQLDDQDSGFSIECEVKGYWTLPKGAREIRFAPDGEPIYLPNESESKGDDR
jgi:hypothetical protein